MLTVELKVTLSDFQTFVEVVEDEKLFFSSDLIEVSVDLPKWRKSVQKNQPADLSVHPL